jgi:hypothetical protein
MPVVVRKVRYMRYGSSALTNTFQGLKATLHAVLLFIFSSALSNSLREKTSVTYKIEYHYDYYHINMLELTIPFTLILPLSR